MQKRVLKSTSQRSNGQIGIIKQRANVGNWEFRGGGLIRVYFSWQVVFDCWLLDSLNRPGARRQQSVVSYYDRSVKNSSSLVTTRYSCQATGPDLFYLMELILAFQMVCIGIFMSNLVETVFRCQTTSSSCIRNLRRGTEWRAIRAE